MSVENRDKPAMYHKPVLVEEVLTYLDPQPGKLYLDVTFGSGGHTRAILMREPRCTVIAFDWDAKTVETYGPAMQEEFGDRFRLVWGNFALLYKLLKKENIAQVDGLLADFGTSQMQIAEREGFSLHRDTPLDMRMSSAHHQMSAAQLLATASEQELRELFWEYGEEMYAKQIARALVAQRRVRPIRTTKQLAELIEHAVPGSAYKRKIHPATKVFQALRIYLNRELENIESLLPTALRVIRPGGRIVCISFHSLEDRLVKQFFKNHERQLQLSILTPRVVVATPDEIEENRSSRSARLRAAEVLQNSK